jgi:sugar phosphate isomerase/epimerase
MPIKFAFSSLSPPTAGIFARAREAGYDGVELSAPLDDSAPLREAAQAAGIEIACLATSFEIPAKAASRSKATAEVQRLIDTTAALRSPSLRLRVGVLRRGQSAGAFATGAKDWLRGLADGAGEQGVTLLIENTPPFARSRELWTLLDLIDHPHVGAAWDPASAARVGETPYVAVPTLNSRIRYVAVGEEDPALHNLLDRLRGIGYSGYVAVRTVEGGLARALVKLRELSGVHVPADAIAGVK